MSTHEPYGHGTPSSRSPDEDRWGYEESASSSPPSGNDPDTDYEQGGEPHEVYMRLLNQWFPWITDSDLIIATAKEWDETDQLDLAIQRARKYVSHTPPPVPDQYVVERRVSTQGETYNIDVPVDPEAYKRASEALNSYEAEYWAEVRHSEENARRAEFVISWEPLDHQARQFAQAVPPPPDEALR